MNKVKVTWDAGQGHMQEADLHPDFHPSVSLQLALMSPDCTIINQGALIRKLTHEREFAKAVIRDEIIEHWIECEGEDEHNINRLNNLLNSLHMDKYTNKWQVDVEYNDVFVMTVIVTGGTREQAEEHVASQITADESFAFAPVKYNGMGECRTSRPQIEIDVHRCVENEDDWEFTVTEFTEV